MRKSGSNWLVVSLVFAGLGLFVGAMAFAGDMSFFVSSAGSGKGADLGGLEGADRICRTLAEAVGAGRRTWRAYLSTQGAGAVNARDRIGAGPWVNAKGVVIAKDLAELHGTNNLTKQTALPRGARSSTVAAIRRICTTSSPDRSPTVRHSALTPTGPAPTGPAAARGRRWSAIPTGSGLTKARR